MAATDNPYVAPQADLAPAPPKSDPSRLRKPGLYLLAAVAIGPAATLLTVAVDGGSQIASRVVMFVGFAAVAVCAGLGAFHSGKNMRRRLFETEQVPARAKVFLSLALIANLGMMFIGAMGALLSTVIFNRGRQLRSFGRPLLPRVRRGADWADLDTELDTELEPSVRSALAAQWRENGRTEHASVAAFARLTLDLMALGAPPELVAGSNRDALDEIRHTELCFSLARAFDGKAESPGPFPEAQKARTLSSNRTLALSQLAVDSLIDGALHEGVSARIIAKLAKRCETPAIRAILKEIAADEGRHAAHGWHVVEWCLAEGGANVAAALEGALSMLPKQMRSPLPDAAKDGDWELLGIHGHALEAEEYASARADLVRRVHALIAKSSTSAAA